MLSYRFEINVTKNVFAHLFNRVLKEIRRVLWLFPFVFAATLSFIFLFSTPAFSQTLEGVPSVVSDAIGARDPIFHEPVSQGINLVFNGRVEESLVIFDRLLKEYPDHPAPHFFKAAAYQVWMSHYRLSKFQSEFEENF
jgi:hypothetical protein